MSFGGYEVPAYCGADDGKPADQAVKELMLRDKKLEVSHLPWPEE